MAATSLNQERLQEICGNIREQLFRNGTTGLSGVARVFRDADFNGNKKLDREEFDEALSFCGLFLKSQETSFLFKNFDRDGDGNINYDELLLGIQLPLSGPRLAMVQRAFQKMDKDGSSIIDINDLSSVYDASQHPDVLEGKKSEAQVTNEFLKGFEVGKKKDGKVTFDEFKAYYQDLGASIPSDEYFVAMMESVWKIRTASAAASEDDSTIKKYVALVKQKTSQKTKTGQRLSLTLKGIFDFFDSDESQAITKDEFSQALVRLGIPLSGKDLDKLFKHFAGSDGRISTAEFIDKIEFDD
jgi:Ca2+-binding EF-hand superfamily protein